MLGLDKNECERVEDFVGAEPDELVFPELDVRVEVLGELGADLGVEPVARDHEVAFADVGDRVDLDLVIVCAESPSKMMFW